MAVNGWIIFLAGFIVPRLIKTLYLDIMQMYYPNALKKINNFNKNYFLEKMFFMFFIVFIVCKTFYVIYFK